MIIYSKRQFIFYDFITTIPWPYLRADLLSMHASAKCTKKETHLMKILALSSCIILVSQDIRTCSRLFSLHTYIIMACLSKYENKLLKLLFS